MLGPGIYENAEITGSALQKGKGEDDPVIVVYFFAEGESITAWLYTTPDAWPWTEKKLRACGWDPAEHDFNLAALNLDGDANPLKGHRVRIECRDEEYDGKVRTKVTWIGEPEGFAEKMPDQEAVAFTQKLRRRLMGSRGTANTPSSAKPPAKQAPPKRQQPPTRATDGPTDEAPW